MTAPSYPLDLTNNRIPDGVRHIHFTAVCGTAMGALACLLKDRGFRITGSDANVYPPMSTFLAEKGITVMGGFRGSNLDPRPDLVVVGNVVSLGNPEVTAMFDLGLSFVSMPQAVNRFAAEGKQRLVVTGTHGKTTTASLLAWMLQAAGRDPSFLIGGILKNFNSSYRFGGGDAMVIEGDEYDTAFFDKGPKFLHYPPHAAILTSIEFDHADIFRDLDHVRTAFSDFLRIIPSGRLLAVYDADPNIADLTRTPTRRLERYGKAAESDWRLGRVAIDPPRTRFEVIRKGRPFGRFETAMTGEHNLLNALSCIAAARELGLSADEIARGLATFKGIKRRQEIRGVRDGITVMDDFAHHPTAVRETLRAVRPFYPDGRLVAVFEPRTNSSMRKVFQEAYAGAFDAADRVLIRVPSAFHKVPEADRISVDALVADLRRRGIDARLYPDTDAILDALPPTLRPGDLVLIMSNGGFDNIHERLLRRI
jgi:UDP-N-acetylmuramate: L-alanyl-gamma-D-glutamyl-meso-diaminopimelate ligase